MHLKVKDSIKIITEKEKVVIRISRKQPGSDVSSPKEFYFELRSLCDIPIMIFKLNPSCEILAVPVNFRKTGVWPQVQKLSLYLQFYDQEAGLIFFEKQILLSKDDTEAIVEHSSEQIKMKPKQIDAIVDFIYSDYIGFAQLSESL